MFILIITIKKSKKYFKTKKKIKKFLVFFVICWKQKIMDHVIESVGSFGRFQFRIIFIVGLVSALSSALIYVIF